MKKLFFVSIIFFLSITQGFSDIKKGDILKFPIVLNEEYNEIKALDIKINYDNSIFEVLEIALDGGILKNQTIDYNYDLSPNITSQEIIISIIATPETKEILENQSISFKGAIAFVSFLVKETPAANSLISIDEFVSNEQDDSGGFEINGQILRELSFEVPCNIGNKKIGIEDAIYTIECLSGIRSSQLNCNISLKSLISILQTLTGINTSNSNNSINSNEMLFYGRSSDLSDIPSAEVVLKKNEVLIPIVLEEKQAIGGIDIKLAFDDTLLKVKSIGIKNGILDGKKYQALSNITKNRALLLICLNQERDLDFVTAKGPVAFVNLEILDNNCLDNKLFLTKFLCNAKATKGGFKISDSTYNILNLKKNQCYKYTITSITEGNGQFNQPETLIVNGEKTVKYKISPDKGYIIDNVVVDNNSLGALDSYIFWSISDNHSISASFKLPEIYTITANTESGGRISPCGDIKIIESKDKFFKISPDTGYKIKDVIVDGSSVGIISKYLFKKVLKNHSINVIFEAVDAPVANFTTNIYNGLAPITVKFTDTSKNQISSWYWDFGDGFNSSLPDPWHTYTLPGDYTVTLNVTGPGGKDKKSDFITINSDYIDFTSNIKTGNAPLNVLFADTSHGYTIISWDFGDGYTQSIQNPSHVYTSPGNYTVSAMALSNGNKITKLSKNCIIVKGRTITGRVIGADSKKGLSNCLLQVWESESLFKGVTIADEYGYYTLTNLPAISGIIIGIWPSYKNPNYIQQFYNNKKNRFSATLLSTIDSNLENIDFILNKKPENSFHGRIMNEKAQGIPNIKVYTFSDNAEKGDSTIADEFGYYTFTNLEADYYKIYVWSSELKNKFYYAIPEEKSYTQYIPILTDSVCEEEHATLIKPENSGLKNINIFINQNGYIKGSVMAENKPVNNIWVKAWSNVFNTGNAALTDENGNYTIYGLISDSNFKPVTYIVEIESQDYPHKVYGTPVTTGSTNINFLLHSNYISGIILDENNLPIPFVDIKACSISNPLNKEGMAQSNISGEYTIYNLPPANDYIVSAFSKDYPVQYYNEKYDKKDAITVNLTSGNANNINFILSKQGIISGIVYIDDNGNINPAQEGILVNVWSKSTNTEKNTFTDSNGFYKITGLNQYIDDYIIFIKHDDYMPAFYKEDGENNYTTVYSINDAAGIAPSDYNRNLVLKKGYTIKGKITYDNKPVSGVIIEAWSDNMFYKSNLSIKKIINGCNYEIKGLKPQLYTIKVLSENFKNQTNNLYINEDKNNFDIILEKIEKKSISGKILNLSKGKKIKILASSRLKNIKKQLFLTGTGSNISYTINELKPSSDYILELYSNDYPYQVFNNSNKIENADFIDLLLDNFNDADFELNTDTCNISGKIEFPLDAIIGEKIQINASSSTGSNIYTTVIYTGVNPLYYTITKLIKANDYIVAISSKNYKTSYYKNASKIHNALTVDISNNSQNNIDFILMNGATISGNVYENGKPIENIKVFAQSNKTKSFGITSTLADGSYIIKGLELSDDFKIKIKKNGKPPLFYNHGNIVSNIYLASNINTLTGNVHNLDIVINQGESIKGRVLNSEGQPLAKIKISTWSYIKQTGYNCYTDNDGSFIIEGLPQSNDYKLIALPDASMPYIKQEKNNISSNSTEINFILLQGFKIEGIIQDNENNPIEKAKIKIRSAINNFKTNITTDYTGKYILKGLAFADDYEISIIPPDKLNLLNLYIKNFVINADIIKDITLSPGFEITGYVYNNLNIPVPNAFVIAFSSSKNFQTKVKTNQDGFYRIHSLPEASDYIIKIISDNYAETQKNNISVKSKIDFYLTDSGYISGSIRNANGIPLQNILVEAYSESLNIRNTDLSDVNGNYKIIGLIPSQNGYPAKDYIVTIHPKDYPLQSQNYKKIFDQVHFILTNNQLSGVVQDFEGNIPPENITVKVILFKNMEKTPCMLKDIDQEGNFKFEGLSSDEEYRLMFSAKGSNLLTPKKWAPDFYHAGDNIIFKFNETW